MHPDKRQKVLLFTPLLLLLLLSQYEVTYSCWLKSYNNSLVARKRRKKKHILWSAINERISDIQFHRMFRMSQDYSDSLFQHIISLFGEVNFKSKAYINAFLKDKNQMNDANIKAAGGYIAG